MKTSTIDRREHQRQLLAKAAAKWRTEALREMRSTLEYHCENPRFHPKTGASMAEVDADALEVITVILKERMV